jgi:aldose 1-epimerase
MSISKTFFGRTPDGNEVSLFTCANANNLVLKLINYGATVMSLKVPDREGRKANVTLGFNSLEGYLQRHPYFGATVGRYCNRIAKGKFTLDGTEYPLATNDGPNHLHGGIVGFDKKVWNAEEVKTANSVGVKFSYQSKDGEEGYPGTLNVTAVYALTNNDELLIEFTAATDKATPVNLTNHSYWNLGGTGAGPILDHEYMITADQVLVVDDTLIPTGVVAEVSGGPFDFTRPRAIKAGIPKMKGYDHCFVLREQDGKLSLAARVKEPKSGRVMEIYTTQPSIQFYTGNFLDGSASNGGFKRHEAFCLETQHYPDSPNQPKFPSTILRQGDIYSQATVHRFLVE